MRLLKIIFFITTSTCCLISASGAFGQSVKKDMTTPVDMGFDNPFPFPSIPNAKLVINGEMHYISSNPIIKFQILKTLYEKNTVRYLIMETGPAMGYLLNEYLRTGIDSLISWNAYLNFELSFWKELKQFNDGLSATEKIEVLAFDFDQPGAYWRMARLALPDRLSDQISDDLLQSLKKQCVPSMKVTDISKANQLLGELLKHDFIQDAGRRVLFEMIVQNKVPMISKTKRDNFTYENFRKYIPGYTRGNFFAEYGVAHVDKKLRHLSYKLYAREDSPLRGNVMTIIPHYFNCVSGRKSLGDFGTPGSAKIPAAVLNGTISDVSILLVDKPGMSKKQRRESADLILIIKNQGRMMVNN